MLVVGTDVTTAANGLLAQGKTPSQVRTALTDQGFSGSDIANALAGAENTHAGTQARTCKLLSVREILDRIGYGAVPPQFLMILLWLAFQGHMLVFFIIGILTGLRTVLSVAISGVLQEYTTRHRLPARTIAGAGILFGFSFFLLAAALLGRSLWLFTGGVVVATVAVVVYGDAYQEFLHALVRRERMSEGLRRIAQWGILVTAAGMLVSGYLLDRFPMQGTDMLLFGMQFHVYGYLLAFMITAFAFILGGYVTSMVLDTREERSYPFWRFVGEYFTEARGKLWVFWHDRRVALLTITTILTGLLQIVITAYGGIALYKLLDARFNAPFLALAMIYAAAIIISLIGPAFTQAIHRSTGLAPTLVFGTLLTAILPLMLWRSQNTAILAVAVCLNVLGSAIVAFGQGRLAQQVMDEEMRKAYFRAQTLVLIIPYLILIPIIAWIANGIPLTTTFLATTIGLVAVVLPLQFGLVILSDRQ